MNDPKAFLITLARKKMIECESKHVDIEDSELLRTPLDNLGLDSLRTLELIMDAESEFGVEIDEDDVDRDFALTNILNRI
ncbi:MAG: phosphopantetheine-binding protein [Pseudomonadota bacterium]